MQRENLALRDMDEEDWNNYTSGCYFFHNGDLHCIECIRYEDDSGELEIHTTGDEYIPLASVSLYIPVLGMINVGEGVVYVSREQDDRQWKILLRSRNTLVHDICYESRRQLGKDYEPSFEEVIYTAHSKEGVYTPVAEAIEAVGNTHYGRAISKDWAILATSRHRQPVLSYRGREVGLLNFKDKPYHLFGGAEYLAESLEEVLNG